LGLCLEWGTLDELVYRLDDCEFEASVRQSRISIRYWRERPLFSFFPLYQINLVDESKFVHAIEEQQITIAESPLEDNAFVYGPISTFWEVFLALYSYMWLLSF
jgi:hypothetical protein